MLGSKLSGDTKLRAFARGVSRWGTLCGVFAMLVFVTGCPIQPPTVSCTDDAGCVDDGLFCNGAEVCLETEICGHAGDPCAEGATCNEDTDHCDVCDADADCDDGDVCTDDACVDAECVNTNNTAACDDGDACTEDDACAGGVCAGTAIVCDDADACTTDACVDGECVYTDVVCGDGETCVDGDCVVVCDTADDCDDDDLCTDDTCLEGICTYADVVCDDAVDCTDDACDADTGDCVYTDNCAEGTCDMDTGECVVAPACDDETPCEDDGLYCNGIDECVDGLCVAGDDPCLDTVCQEGQTVGCDEGDDEAVCTCEGEGVTYDFTLSQDNLTGSTGDDIFLAPLLFNESSGTQIASLQTGDSANGLAGTDELTASFNPAAAATVVPQSLQGIETINITNFGSAALTLSATNIVGVDTINQLNSVEDLVVTGLQELTDFGFDTINDTTVDMSLTFAQATTTSGSADEITCTLNAATVGTATVTTSASSTNGFETFNFVSTGDTANQLTTLTQTNGNTMATADFAGAQDLKVTVMPTTVLTYNAADMTGDLTLGTGTSTADYTTFATANLTSLTGGAGDDTIIFAATLNGSDFTSASPDLGDGTDVVVASFSSSYTPIYAWKNIEEFRTNATANGVTVNFNGTTGLTSITNEGDGTANTLTFQNVPATSSVFPTLAYRGNNTQAAQTYDSVTYTATGVTGSSDTLNITVGNRGTALNTGSATTNVHTVGGAALTAAGFENVNITVTDGPATFSGLTASTLVNLDVNGSSNVTMGTIAATGVTVTSVDFAGVVGNVSATCDYMLAGGTITGSSTGNNTITVGTNSTATTLTITTGAGNDTIVCDSNTSCADTIQSGTGSDTITPGPGADIITTGTGTDTIIMDTTDFDEAAIDTVSDFSVSDDKITFDVSSIEALNIDSGVAGENISDWASADITAGDGFSIEVITVDGTTVASAVDMAIISDALATFANCAAYVAAVTATVDLVGLGAATAEDSFLIAYEDGSGNTRIGVFADDAGAGADSDSFDLCEDILILTGVNAASLTASNFNSWQ